MQRASPSTHNPARRRRRSGADNVSPGLAELATRFARFRKRNRRGTRVPEELRAAALAALDQGAASGELHRSCGITWSQIMAWQARREVAPAKPRRAAPPDVRVFSVVDELPADRPAVQDSTTEHELQLRLGSWSVTVRLATPGEREES